MNRYGVLLSCASEMAEPGLVTEYRTHEAAANAAVAIAKAQSGVIVTTCTDRGDGWDCGLGQAPREWLAQFQ